MLYRSTIAYFLLPTVVIFKEILQSSYSTHSYCNRYFSQHSSFKKNKIYSQNIVLILTVNQAAARTEVTE